MAVAITFNELEKIIQEKLFYKILFKEYFKTDHLIGHGFRMTKNNFIINMVLARQLSISVIQDLAGKIGQKYNIFVDKNAREEKPRWSLDYPTPNSFSYIFFIESEHDESNLNSENFKKMIGFF